MGVDDPCVPRSFFASSCASNSPRHKECGRHPAKSASKSANSAKSAAECQVGASQQECQRNYRPNDTAVAAPRKLAC